MHIRYYRRPGAASGWTRVPTELATARLGTGNRLAAGGSAWRPRQPNGRLVVVDRRWCQADGTLAQPTRRPSLAWPLDDHVGFARRVPSRSPVSMRRWTSADAVPPWMTGGPTGSLASRDPRTGGRRWYWTCPSTALTGRRCGCRLVDGPRRDPRNRASPARVAPSHNRFNARCGVSGFHARKARSCIEQCVQIISVQPTPARTFQCNRRSPNCRNGNRITAYLGPMNSFGRQSTPTAFWGTINSSIDTAVNHHHSLPPAARRRSSACERA